MRDQLLPWWTRLLVASAFALVAAAGSNAAAAAALTAHTEAMKALTDLEMTVHQIDASSRLTANLPAPYKRAGHGIINTLVGKNDSLYQASAGKPQDTTGALGHLNWLRAHAKGHIWASAVNGAWVNAMVARAHLYDALHAKELSDFQQSVSEALQALLVSLGSESGLGGVAGLRGALATTDIGVPDGATVVSGCAPAHVAPAYGVIGGYLTFVALPKDSTQRLPESIAVTHLAVKGGTVTLYTAAEKKVATLCTTHKAATTPANDAPSLYTEAQAVKGSLVFAQKCVACHGADLQGKSAPPIAGSRFLKKTGLLGWTIANLRDFVLNSMPMNNPGTLSARQYAEVLSYVLATNCYPAGNRPFPQSSTATLKAIKLKPLASVHPDNPDIGTCATRQQATSQ